MDIIETLIQTLGLGYDILYLKDGKSLPMRKTILCLLSGSSAVLSLVEILGGLQAAVSLMLLVGGRWLAPNDRNRRLLFEI